MKILMHGHLHTTQDNNSHKIMPNSHKMTDMLQLMNRTKEIKA